MKLLYIISNNFDYENLICADAGPDYARRLGLEVRKIGDFQPDEKQVLFTDNRLNSEELEQVVGWATQGKKIIFRVHDPFFQSEGDRPLTHAVFRCARFKNVGIVSTYQPREVIKLILSAYGSDRVHILPYPYMRDSELSIKQPRKKKVILSGAKWPVVYPLRNYAMRRRWLDIRWRMLSEVLVHPGYLDINQKDTGGYRGDAYIRFLAHYDFMFLCPTRFGIELMKYNECGYALCCPVGQPAEFLPQAARDAFVLFEPSCWRSAASIVSSMDPEEVNVRAHQYRQAMRNARRPEDIRSGLDSWAGNLFG